MFCKYVLVERQSGANAGHSNTGRQAYEQPGKKARYQKTEAMAAASKNLMRTSDSAVWSKDLSKSVPTPDRTSFIRVYLCVAFLLQKEKEIGSERDGTGTRAVDSGGLSRDLIVLVMDNMESPIDREPKTVLYAREVVQVSETSYTNDSGDVDL